MEPDLSIVDNELPHSLYHSSRNYTIIMMPSEFLTLYIDVNKINKNYSVENSVIKCSLSHIIFCEDCMTKYEHIDKHHIFILKRIVIQTYLFLFYYLREYKEPAVS